MMKQKKIESKFAEKIFEIVTDDDIDQNLDSLNREMMDAFLAEGSASPDNLNCIEHVEYGLGESSFNSDKLLGFKVKGKNLLLSDLFNHLENLDLPPEEIRNNYPELSSDEWSGALRMVTMLLISLERSKK